MELAGRSMSNIKGVDAEETHHTATAPIQLSD
jgi:hypothetical protein